MGSVGTEVSGGGVALLPSDTSQNVELTRQFELDTGISVHDVAKKGLVKKTDCRTARL